MTAKRWAMLSLLLIGLALGLCAGVVAFVDPFAIYHAPDNCIPPITNGSQSYFNAGIAKTYDYDSVIIGSSMTENFVPSQLDALLGGRFVKLCINGGTSFNHRQMMEMAFGTHEIKTVLYGLDLESLTNFYKTPKAEMPDYLYDDSLLNDVRYWFNGTVLLKYVPACLRTWGQTDPDLRDTMYAWGDLYAYGREAVLGKTRINGDEVVQDPAEETPVLSQQSMLNVEHNIVPFIEAHPETEFIVFFPPYSLLRWYQFYRQGTMQYHLNQKGAVVGRLLSYDNVRIYDFQARMDWITDLDNYIDAGHYGPEINAEIARLIARDEGRVLSLAQVLESSAALRGAVDDLRARGEWPDSFDN
ncbi:MAG: hypothetical protein ACI4PG_00405 [Candidatus Ventricola sp.]